MFELVKSSSYEEEIRKSRFIATADKVSSHSEALAFLEKIRQMRATHHCWAYRIGTRCRFSDDGEPAGTAGRPILNAIDKQEIDGVMLVVVRYYGGIKLGTGGLARAYGGCAAKCLQGAVLKRIEPMVDIRLRVGFHHIGALYATIDPFSTEKLAEDYTDTGLELKLSVKRSDCQALVSKLTDASSGGVEFLEGC